MSNYGFFGIGVIEWFNNHIRLLRVYEWWRIDTKVIDMKRIDWYKNSQAGYEIVRAPYTLSDFTKKKPIVLL